MSSMGREQDLSRTPTELEAASSEPAAQPPKLDIASAVGNRAFANSVAARKADDAGEPAGIRPDGTAAPEVEAEIAARRGAGAPLDAGVRDRIGDGLGGELPDVRVHTDPVASSLARAVSARAFTVGSDVFFGDGEYRPGTTDGDALIAHETAHAIQQSGAPTSGPLQVSRPGDAQEVEADSAADQALSRAPATRFSRQAIARAPEDAALERDRDDARDHLDALEDSLEDYVRAHRRWLSANWVRFYSLTSSNPRLSLGKAGLDGLVSNAIGNAAADTVKGVGKRVIARGAGGAAGAAAGGAIANLPGLAIGFVIGVVIETVAGLIHDSIGPSSEEKARAAEAEQVGLLVEDSEKALQLVETAGFAEARASVDKARAALAEMEDQTEIIDFGRAARLEATRAKLNRPVESDRSLAQFLLQDWVLEHAGDENDEDSETNQAQWEKALAVGFRGKDALEGYYEMFAYQTRSHFGAAGLDITEIQRVIDNTEPWARDRLVRHKRDRRDLPGSIHEKTMKANDRSRFTFDKARDPEALIRFLGSQYAELTDEGKQAIREGRFKLECTLDLEEDEGTVYVDEWEWTVTFPGEGKWWVRTSPPHARRNPLSFTHSPD